MRTTRFFLFVVLSAIVLAGCAYRYYLGMHGPSVRGHAAIHAGITKDTECLACHAPQNNPRGPVTSHPQFTGCLKCHNDELKEKTSPSLQ